MRTPHKDLRDFEHFVYKECKVPRLHTKAVMKLYGRWLELNLSKGVGVYTRGVGTFARKVVRFTHPEVSKKRKRGGVTVIPAATGQTIRITFKPTQPLRLAVKTEMQKTETKP